MNINAIETRRKNRLTRKLDEIRSFIIAYREKKRGQPQNVERRLHKRLESLTDRLRIVDWQNKQELGRVSDISLGGLRLVSNALLPLNETFSVHLEVKMGGNFSKVMTSEACSTWQRKRSEDNLYETGFYFANLSTDDYQHLKRIIDVLTVKSAEEASVLSSTHCH